MCQWEYFQIILYFPLLFCVNAPLGKCQGGYRKLPGVRVRPMLSGDHFPKGGGLIALPEYLYSPYRPDFPPQKVFIPGKFSVKVCEVDRVLFHSRCPNEVVR